MSALGSLLRIGIDILSTALGSNTDPDTGETTGTLIAQTGNVVAGTTDDANAEWWQSVGFASRPPNPTAGKAACQGIAIRGDGDHDIVICSRDTRTNNIYGNLGPGETCVSASGVDGQAQAAVMLKGDGSVTLYTTDDNTPSGQAIFAMLHPTKGFMIVAPWGTLTFDQVGLRVKHQSGFGINGGSVGGLPGPFAALSSYLTMTAASCSLNGSQVYLGGGPLYYCAAGGLGSIPLTMPGIPIAPVGFGVPCGVHGD